MYAVDLLLPTARFVFAVRDGRVEVVPEHRSPEAFTLYRRLREECAVVGMTTFPNTVLLRGPQTIVVDPGLHLQNQPIIAALAERGLAPADVDLIALTHAHLDHAGACVDLCGTVAVHELELADDDRPMVAGVLPRERLRLLRGDSGELAPGVTWLRTPGHTDGGVAYRVETVDGPVVLAGDTIGPFREPFDAMVAPDDDPCGPDLLESWRVIRALGPTTIIAGHVPPFSIGSD